MVAASFWGGGARPSGIPLAGSARAAIPKDKAYSPAVCPNPKNTGIWQNSINLAAAVCLRL